MAINASAELSVLQAVAQFLTYAVMAVFAENAVFFRALGVSRLNKLVNDPKISTWQYCIPIILVQTISAPMGWAAQSLTLPALAKVLPGWLPVNALRPLVFLNCSLIAMGIVWLLLGLFPKSRDACREQLPGATFNCCVLGTLLARTSEFLATFGYILFKDKELGLRIKHLLHMPGEEFFSNYLRLGLPVLVSDGLLGLGGNIVSIILGHMGAAVVAANAICQVIDRLFTVVIQGISNASSIVTGHTLGEGSREKAMQQGYTFYVLSIFFGLIAAVMVLACGPLTIAMYTLNDETILMTEEMMGAYAVIVFFQCIQSVMTKGVLRGGGDTKFLMKADILFMWLVSIPLGGVGGLLLGWPAWLTILALRVDYVIKSVWCISRLKSGKWIHTADGIAEEEPEKVTD